MVNVSLIAPQISSKMDSGMVFNVVGGDFGVVCGGLR